MGGGALAVDMVSEVVEVLRGDDFLTRCELFRGCKGFAFGATGFLRGAIAEGDR